MNITKLFLVAAIAMFAMITTPAAQAANTKWVYIGPEGVVTLNPGDVVARDLDGDGRDEFVLAPAANQKLALGGTSQIFCGVLTAGGQGVCFPIKGSRGVRIPGGFRINFPGDPQICAKGQVPFVSNLVAPGAGAGCWPGSYFEVAIVGTWVWQSLPSGGCRQTGTLGGATTFALIDPVPTTLTGSCTFFGQPSWTGLAVDLATGQYCPNATTVTPNCPGGGTTTGWNPDPGGGGGTTVTNDNIFRDGFE